MNAETQAQCPDTSSIADRIGEILHSLDGTTIHFDPKSEGPTEGVFRPVESLGLHAESLAMVRSRFPNGLFRHQHEAIAEVLADLRDSKTSQRSFRYQL
jgi:hypothetical protein